MSKKQSFTLKNVDIDAINVKYGLILISNIDKEAKISGDKTKISDIILSEPEYALSFLDENKKNYDCVATMVNFSTLETLPVFTDKKCFWCRHNFDSRPIGCPIKYVNSTIEKSYVSQITKDEYRMKENITKTKMDRILSMDHSGINISSVGTDYYLTDGIFCSFNCTLAFINDNNKDSYYKDSIGLLHSLYKIFIGKKIEKLVPAPHWRLLSDYGGPFSINEFRDKFNKIMYEDIFKIVMKSISRVYKNIA